ncbi:coiled-coil domain-containing protein 42 homolog isoform X3 [Rhynchophorus ferrugineus]|uniref:coiled-coil domain-containing protein 42 homolog isoform X3 n=1 Tax=Rhynchophorus ferrugineus TaxID=354439 RepID=UPI003FCE282D
MDASNKTAVFDKMFFPKKPNYEYTAEFFHSKATEEQRKIGTYNTGDNIERNVTISNYLAKKQLEKTTKKLNVKRKEYQEKRKYVLDQWEDLKKKEEGLRQNFIRFNQFVKENQEKKERAANKIVEQNALKKERQKRMDDLLEKCDQITKVKAQMDKNINRYRIYEKFLMTVVDYEPSVQSVGDLLKRYEALIGARKELNDIQQRDLNKLEKAKTNLMKLIEEKNFIIMGLNNQIANLQARYENANIKALESETLVTQIKNNAVRQLSEINMVKNSIWNVYVHMAASKKHPIKIKRENVEEQMMYINRTLTELSKVNKLIKKRSTKIK